MKEMEAYMWFERRKEVKAMVYKRGIKFIAVLTGLFFMGMLQTYSLAGEISQEASKKEIKPVNPELVCMVNDSVMKGPQIPVPVEGKTYYGCCEGCVKTLQSDRSVRVAKDPVTGHEVDKAKAFILAGPKRKALYFESQETAREYLSKKR